MVNNSYFLGLDIGSTTSKAVVLDKNKKLLFFFIIDSGSNLKNSANILYKTCLRHLKLENIKNIISTGYGRYSASFSKKQITEITAHAIGSKFLYPKTRTIIDIGGQDSKIIKLDKDGNVINFIMNDKCSAGCGRFLENMSKKLNIPLQDFDKLARKAKKDLKLNSTCTVFQESEIVSCLAKKEKKETIIKSLLTCLVNKIISLGSNIGFDKDIILTGGAAKNSLLKIYFNNTLNKKFVTPKEPQITAALGAALYGLNKFKA